MWVKSYLQRYPWRDRCSSHWCTYMLHGVAVMSAFFLATCNESPKGQLTDFRQGTKDSYYPNNNEIVFDSGIRGFVTDSGYIALFTDGGVVVTDMKVQNDGRGQPQGDKGVGAKDGAVINNGASWSENDPPTKDLNKAKTYCDKAMNLFNKYFTEYRDKQAAIGDLNTLYHLERLFHGMTGVYEVIGDKKLASDLLDIALKIVGAGVDFNQDGYLDYCFRDEKGNITPRSSDEPPCDNDPKLMCTYPWRALWSTAQALRVAMKAGLSQTRSSDVAKLKQFVLHDVIDKWLDLDGPGADKYQSGSHTAGIDSRMAGILLETFWATGDPRIGEMAREWVLWIATDMVPLANKEGAYWFDNWILDNDKRSTPADTSHANEIVQILIEGFEAGFLPYSFIEPLHSTWVDILWNGDLNNTQFREYVDGTGEWQNGHYSTGGWMRLGQFKGKTQKLAEKMNYSTSYDLDVMEVNGNLCRIFGLAQTKYPLPYPSLGEAIPGGQGGVPGQSSQVICNTATCNRQKNEVCCIRAYSDSSYADCDTSCTSSAVACDGPEDCGGKACCGIFGVGWRCSNTNICPKTELQLCHSTNDCPAEMKKCCGNTGLPGMYYAVCSPLGSGTCN